MERRIMVEVVVLSHLAVVVDPIQGMLSGFGWELLQKKVGKSRTELYFEVSIQPGRTTDENKVVEHDNHYDVVVRMRDVPEPSGAVRSGDERGGHRRGAKRETRKRRSGPKR